jgi:16S rRNA (cytosine967-C5)-methyltransferase
MKYHSHLNSAVLALQQYKGGVPFSFFIKDFFRQDKKFGSKDRKSISHLCYCYFRLGPALKGISIEEKILTGFFLCNQNPSEMLAHLKPDWDANIHLSLENKIPLVPYPFAVTDIFPWKEELSKEVDYPAFCASLLVQPDVFLRIRPGFEEMVKEKLKKNAIAFELVTENAVALPNGSKLEEIIHLNKEAVVQDYSSQRVGSFFPIPTLGMGNAVCSVWDCCAASGGKSIMAVDAMGEIDLTVSDIRDSILANLKKRFEEAGIKKYTSFKADLGSDRFKTVNEKYDFIIADLPCSGSGTWGRSPEAISYFDKREIEIYSQLQKKIMGNILPALKPKGKLLYITCSVFQKENEELVSYIQEQMRLEKMEIIKGYDKKADTMFAALFQKDA